MPAQSILMSIFTLALLLPVMYRRYQRRTGVAPASFSHRRGRLVVMAMASVVLVGMLGATAMATDGDRNGSKTGTNIENVLRSGPAPGDAVSTLAGQTEKNRVSINITWLMLGGILVLFMQAGFALVETGFTRAKNASHTMMMNMVIFALGVVGWFVCGYALMFGATSQGVIGLSQLGNPIHLGPWNLLAKSRLF